MSDPVVFTFADSRFYEPLSRYKLSPEYVERVHSLVPASWAIRTDGLWAHVASDLNRSIAQGFKIHVSSTTECAASVLDTVVPECVRAQVNFKFAADPSLLQLLNSKRYHRGGSGKFLTVYPPTEAVFRKLIEKVHRATSTDNIHGPYILSDRRYKKTGVVYYRYGGFARRQRLSIDGSKIPVILSPSGEEVEDRRQPFFEMPPWVQDPFGNENDVAPDGGVTLDGRYAIEDVLAFSNSGGVYAGTDLISNRAIVIKESRPYTHQMVAGTLFVDAVALLRHEYEILRRLGYLPFVPEPVALITEWEHTFLVEAQMDGIPYGTFWAQNENILAPYIRVPGRIAAWAPKFCAIAQSLIDMVERVHECGVVIGDLSPGNVLVQPDTLALALIDFEGAVVRGEEHDFAQFANTWMTPGYGNPARESRREPSCEDDFYSVGMLLFHAVAAVPPLIRMKPEAGGIVLTALIQDGLPQQVADVIRSLLRGDVIRTKAILAMWTREMTAVPMGAGIASA